MKRFEIRGVSFWKAAALLLLGVYLISFAIVVRAYGVDQMFEVLRGGGFTGTIEYVSPVCVSNSDICQIGFCMLPLKMAVATRPGSVAPLPSSSQRQRGPPNE